MFRILMATSVVGRLALGQPAYDPAAVLGIARDKIIDLTKRIPKYTCTQTMNRTYYAKAGESAPRLSRLQGNGTCDQYAGDRRRKIALDATDRLRLDVIVTDGQEVFSWVGASRFESGWVGDLIGGGPIGTGAFGPFLIEVFENSGVSFEYRESTRLHGHTVFEYSYQVPVEASHDLARRKDGSWQTTAFSGSFWVNPETKELERLTVRTSELPLETGACTADTRVDYRIVHLVDGEFLLPRENELHFLLRNGRESNNISTYANCHQFLAESKLSFEEPSSESPQPVAPADTAPEIPIGLKVVLALTQPVDTDVAAGGDRIEARVKADVRDPNTRKVAIPAGAIVQGRIVRMEHRLRPQPHFLISIAWQRLEDHGRSTPFFARIVEADDLKKAAGAAGFLQTRATIWLPPPGESKRAGGWFIIPTTKPRNVVPAGYSTTWRTDDPPAAK